MWPNNCFLLIFFVLYNREFILVINILKNNFYEKKFN